MFRRFKRPAILLLFPAIALLTACTQPHQVEPVDAVPVESTQ